MFLMLYYTFSCDFPIQEPYRVPTGPWAVLTSAQMIPRRVHDHCVLQLSSLQLPSLDSLSAGSCLYATWLSELLKLHRP
jgi:hypothetical protein